MRALTRTGRPVFARCAHDTTAYINIVEKAAGAAQDALGKE